MQLRKMTESDLPQVLELQGELAFQDWDEKQFLSEIRASYAYCIVCKDESLTDAAIIEALKPKLEVYKLPAAIERIDAIPKTASGKVQRLKLK